MDDKQTPPVSEEKDEPVSVDGGVHLEGDDTKATTHPGYVYFIGPPGLSGHVKIGWARCPPARLTVLQTGSPERLILYASFTGSREDGRQMHREFAHLRKKGEWFNYDHDLMLLIIGLGADYDLHHNDGTECGKDCNAKIITRFRSQLERRYNAFNGTRRLMRSL
jgi:hypothetical protein